MAGQASHRRHTLLRHTHESFDHSVDITGTLSISSSLPILRLSDTDAGTNEKNWLLYASGQQLLVATASDAVPGTAASTAYAVARSGTALTSVTFSTVLEVATVLPILRLGETDAAADEKYWLNYASGGDLFFATAADATPSAAATTIMSFIRGTGTAMSHVAIGGAGTVNVTTDGRLYGTALHNSAGSVAGATNQHVASGTYTPTLTAVTNVAASTAYACQWMRVGNVVTISGRFDLDPTSSGVATELGMSLPIASDFAAAGSNEAGGAAIPNGVAGGLCAQADTTNNRIKWVTGDVNSAANAAWFFTATYLIL